MVPCREFASTHTHTTRMQLDVAKYSEIQNKINFLFHFPCFQFELRTPKCLTGTHTLHAEIAPVVGKYHFAIVQLSIGSFIRCGTIESSIVLESVSLPIKHYGTVHRPRTHMSLIHSYRFLNGCDAHKIHFISPVLMLCHVGRLKWEVAGR